MSQAINSKRRTRAHHQIVLVLVILSACVAANVLTGFFFRAFTFWRSLSIPSSGAKEIVDADPYSLWVETSDNQIFTLSIDCDNNENCLHWILVDEVADIEPLSYGYPISREASCTNFPYGESPGNPRGQIVECVKAIYPGIEFGTGFETFFVLMADGSVKYRQFKGSAFGMLCIAPSVVVTLATILIYYFKKSGVQDPKAG